MKVNADEFIRVYIKWNRPSQISTQDQVLTLILFRRCERMVPIGCDSKGAEGPLPPDVCIPDGVEGAAATLAEEADVVAVAEVVLLARLELLVPYELLELN
jgi:hypothetical protein